MHQFEMHQFELRSPRIASVLPPTFSCCPLFAVGIAVQYAVKTEAVAT
jgi:hypothetical protein